MIAADIEHLGTLARAADPTGAVHLITHYRNSADTAAEEAFSRAATPTVVLELIELASRYLWIEARAQREGRDGGWTGYYRLPNVDGWDDTPYAAARKEGFHHKTLDEAVDAARGKA